MKQQQLLLISPLALAGVMLSGTAMADSVETRLDLLAEELQRQRQAMEAQERTLREQATVIELQAALLRQQRDELARLRQQVVGTGQLEEQRAVGRPPAPALIPSVGAAGVVQAPGTATSAAPSSPPVQVAQAEPPQPVGQAPKEEDKKRSPLRTKEGQPEVPSLSDIGGVLTPKGQLVLEPSMQFSNSQINRLSFVGVEILETFLIGIIEAEDADRDLYSPALTARYGLTNRLELEAKVPYIWRDDTVRVTIPEVTGDPRLTRNLTGDGLGDVELAVHYQLNRGLNGWPFFVGNVRYKSTTGDGPFDVNTDANGLQTELATGTGFHGIEPSVTVLFPSDPAVFFGNVGYLFHLEDNVDKTIKIADSDPQKIGDVDPGDALRLSFGMAYAINQAAAFTIGYKHDFIEKTKTEINNVTFSSSSLDVGAVLLGYSYGVNEHFGWNLNFEFGVTDDAPDVTATLRLPYSF